MDVLVVDDDYVARRMVEHTLHSAGYQVVTACDGEQALSLVINHGYQLVVSDWRMPRMDGVELCRAIRSADMCQYTYFIMLTSRDRPVDTISGFTTGVDDYIAKPFNPHELLMRVNVGRRILELETSQLTIFALAKLAESRDLETGAHLERVRSYCKVLASQLQHSRQFQEHINDEFVRLIYQTSPLHDIGKVAIPDAILLKPGMLTRAEFEIMKTHTLRGAETLDAALQEFPHARFLRMAKDIALTHHERYDGQGYPHALFGKEIPLCGRIVALADVYDALTSKRVYKEAYAHDVARSTIVENAGRHFDPAIVDAFLATEEEFTSIRSRHGEETEEASLSWDATELSFSSATNQVGAVT